MQSYSSCLGADESAMATAAAAAAAATAAAAAAAATAATVVWQPVTTVKSFISVSYTHLTLPTICSV